MHAETKKVKVEKVVKSEEEAGEDADKQVDFEHIMETIIASDEPANKL